MTKAEEIKNYMVKLGISKEEALKLWEDDHSDIVLEEVKTIEEKAKQIRRYEKSDKPRKNTPKERKIDPDKLFLIEKLAAVASEISSTATRKNEAEINFIYNDANYTIKLIKHRAEKEAR